VCARNSAGAGWAHPDDHPGDTIFAGVAIGGLLGETLGSGSVAGALLGAVGGGVAGNAIERKTRPEDAQEIVVRLDGGGTMGIVQPGMQHFQPGQRVRVLTSPTGSRVGPG
jgi:outer membrane lipoprotein SlyB